VRTEQRFAPSRSSVPAVRRFVLAAINVLPRAVVDRVMLIVSELATNAVVHAGGEFVVGVELGASLLRIEVLDPGGGVPEVQPVQPPTAFHGRGLQIVDHLADRWGTEPSDAGSGKMVWVELRLDVLEPQQYHLQYR
jgi:anti-sigma regulatory factor (Ser/Thr protein kinase)